jgi:hypothetical protein
MRYMDVVPLTQLFSAGSGTERRGRVVNTPASYSGSPRFKSGPGDWLFRVRFSWFSSVLLGKFRDNT